MNKPAAGQPDTRSRDARGPEVRAAVVREIVDRTPVFDIHTHLYDPAFGEMLLWGIDDLLVYHYLVAEAFRYSALPYNEFWALPKAGQADLIWDALFVRNSPISEACRGVLTTLHHLGLDVKQRDLPSVRQWFARQRPEDHITRCLELGNVRRVCMTNSPFDDAERPVWERGFSRDERFVAALRIDPLLLEWPASAGKLKAQGYDVTAVLNDRTLGEIRRFLADWAKRIDALYVMCSLPPAFNFPDAAPASLILEKALLPFCREHGLAFAMMIGSKRAVNPSLLSAGDSLGRADIGAVERLCAGFPENKFLVTMLSRENQHELCVTARKFRNLHIFGCWWFMNIPSLVDEITSMRLELIGLSVTPQHSDARVLDQLIYKWAHSREVIGRVLAAKYNDLAATGWEATRKEMERDAQNLFGGAFEAFLRG